MYLVAASFVSVSGAAKAAVASRREDIWMNMFAAVHGIDGRENEAFEGQAMLYMRVDIENVGVQYIIYTLPSHQSIFQPKVTAAVYRFNNPPLQTQASRAGWPRHV